MDTKMEKTNPIGRRHMILSGLAAAAAFPAHAVSAPAVVRVQRNASSFLSLNWQEYFDKLGRGAIIADTNSRALHFWGGDGVTYKLFPSSVPMTDELTRRGYTEVVRKKVGPGWTPTANMRKRDPSLPKFMPPGPGNPLGTHALYLSWPAYLVHGTHDTRKIGRKSSSGCIGLYNEHIAELFGLVSVGTQVLLI